MRGVARPVLPVAVAVAVAVVTWTAACGGSPETAPSAVAVDRDTIGDTVVVRTSETVGAPSLVLVPTGTTIGTLAGAPETILGRVGSIALGPSGDVHVLDQQAVEVRVFHEDGRFVRTIGGGGSGPGEFSKPDAVAVLPDGRVLVRDVGAGRLHVFGSDGEFVEGWPVLSRLFGTSDPLRTDDLGRTWVETRHMAEDGSLGPRVTVIVGSDGTPLDTLPDPAAYVDPSIVEFEIRSEKGTSRYTSTVPFTPGGYWAVHPNGGLVRGTPDARGVEIVAVDGTVRRFVRDRDPVPVTDQERRYHRDLLTAQLRAKSSDWTWNGPPIPETKPEVGRVFAGRDGRIWAGLSAPGVRVDNPMHDPGDPLSTPEVWTQPLVFDLFESDGSWVGRVEADASMATIPTPIFMEDGAWAVTRDDLGVERVQWFELRPAPGR